MEYEGGNTKRGNRKSLATTVVVQNTMPRSGRASMGGRFGGSQRTNVSSSSVMNLNSRPAGELAMMSKKSVDSVRDTRSKEKAEIGGLNQILADRIEKMKFMEGQNKQLQMELAKWKAMKMFDETKLKDIESEEIEELRDAIKQLNETNAKFTAENMKLRDKVVTNKEDMLIVTKQRDAFMDEKEKLSRMNGDLEAENLKLRREIELVEKRHKMVEEQLVGIQDDVKRLADDLESARVEQMLEVQRALQIQDDLQYQLDCKDAEINEYIELIKSMQSVEPDYKGMWEGQFKESLMKLQADCDDRIQRQAHDLEARYQSQMARLQASIPRDQPDSSIRKVETKTLKSEMGNMKSDMANLQRENASLKDQILKLQRDFEEQCRECEQEKNELRELLASEKLDKAQIEEQLDELDRQKDSLELEIATYQRLLESAGMGDDMASRGNYQSYGGSMLSQAITGGRGGEGGSGGYGNSTSYGSGGGGGGSASQSSNPTPGKKAQSPTDKPSKKKPDNARSESSGRISTQKTSTGVVVIEEIAVDGSYCTLKNKTNKDVDISGWKMKKTSAGNQNSEYVFLSGQTLKNTIKVYSYRFSDDARSGDLAATDGRACKTWGSGAGKMTLYDKAGQEVATYTVNLS